MMTEAGKLTKNQRTKAVETMDSKTSAIFGRVDMESLEKHRGRIVALDSATGAVIEVDDDLQHLAGIMKERHPNRDYFAYGVPSAKDFAQAREAQS